MVHQIVRVTNDYQDPPRPGVSATDVTSFVYGYVNSAASYLERW